MVAGKFKIQSFQKVQCYLSLSFYGVSPPYDEVLSFRGKYPKPCWPWHGPAGIPCAVHRHWRRANSLRSNSARLFSGAGCTARPCHQARGVKCGKATPSIVAVSESSSIPAESRLTGGLISGEHCNWSILKKKAWGVYVPYYGLNWVGGRGGLGPTAWLHPRRDNSMEDVRR